MSMENIAKDLEARTIGIDDTFRFHCTACGKCCINREEVYNVMNDLVKQGKCVIMVSSEMPEILAMSNRVMVMRGGRVMAMIDRDSEHFNQEDIMKAAWGGSVE